ncbi:MAG: DUF4386 domain-containing protein [Spirochaetaceae bacterium]
MNKEIKTLKVTAVVFISYFVIGMTCYFVLASVFQFPDILREDGELRFNLFRLNQKIIVPTYYFWAFTGLLQITMASLIYVINKKSNVIDILALVFGILSGTFQVVGFIRWIVLIPILADAYHSGVSSELIFFIEKLANAYLGKTLGEHMGNLLLAIWTILVSIRFLSSKFNHRSLGTMGIITGSIFLLFSFESLGSIFSVLSILTVPVWGLFYIWLIFMAISFFKSKLGQQTGKLHWGFWICGLLFWLSNIIPSYL